MPNAARIGHELTEIRVFSHDRYKKGSYMLRGISSKMNVKAAVELILQLEC